MEDRVPENVLVLLVVELLSEEELVDVPGALESLRGEEEPFAAELNSVVLSKEYLLDVLTKGAGRLIVTTDTPINSCSRITHASQDNIISTG